MSSSVLFGESSIFAKIDSITSLGMDRKLDKLLGFGPGKPTVQRIGELATQSAKEGGARPIVWGRVRPISGNIMHSGPPVIKRVEVKNDSGGGKGGSKKPAKQYQERVFKSYAIRICEGPITGIIRVWRNNKLVYDARGNAWGTKNNGVFLKRAKFYLGDWDQMPDPTLESIWGAGEVPGYRGTCYMVVADEDLTEQGGALPQFIFEVERAEGSYLTSKPYRVELSDSMSVSASSGELFLKDKIIYLPGMTDHMSCQPGVSELSLMELVLRPIDYMSTTPGISEIKLSATISGEIDYLSVTPGVSLLKSSISYTNGKPEYLACTPGVSEIALI